MIVAGMIRLIMIFAAAVFAAVSGENKFKRRRGTFGLLFFF
jgi:hypothetical protein